MAPELSAQARLFMHALLGGTLGFIASIIFLLVYYGQQFTVPVSDSIRFQSAFWFTFWVFLVVLGIIFRKDIISAVRLLLQEPEKEPVNETNEK